MGVGTGLNPGGTAPGRGRGRGGPRNVFRPRGNCGDSNQSASRWISRAVSPAVDARVKLSCAGPVWPTAVTQLARFVLAAFNHAMLGESGGKLALPNSNRDSWPI